MEEDSSSQVVTLLNNAQTAANTDSTKLDNLRKVQEIIVNKDPNLLDNFLDEVLAFQTDRSQDVRKFVVGFIEDACVKDAELLPKVIANLQLLLGDHSVVVQKRVIQAMTHVYRSTLKWLARTKNVSDSMEAAWTLMCQMKEIIVGELDSDNDGIRTITVKFMEMVVLIQTHREPESMVKEGDFSLDDLPLGLKLARPRKLEEEARKIFEDMVKYHGSAHISSANLMTTMGSLTNIARLRPTFMSRVITALEMLQANLPPTLARSQVSSVRKHLKNQLLTLLRHPTAAENFFTNMTTLLTDLGANRDEVMRAMPNYEEMRRKARKKEREAEKAKEAAKEAQESKRPKIDIPDAEDEEEEESSKLEKPAMAESAVDITERFVFNRLKDPAFATELVLVSMTMLPSVLPPHFNNTYTPIAAAGSEGQVRHVSRLLATQLTNAGLGPGVSEEFMRQDDKTQDDEEEEQSEPGRISTVVGMTTNTGQENKDKAPVKLTPAGLTSKKMKSGKMLKLSEVTKPLSVDTRQKMVVGAVQRILSAEKAAVVGGVPGVRNKIIATLAASLSEDKQARTILLDFIFADLSSRVELAFSWLYEEYCMFQGFNRTAALMNKKPGDDSAYNSVLCSLIHGVSIKPDLPSSERDSIIRRLYLESPIITDEAISLLKSFCQGEGSTGGGALAGVHLMKDLVMLRPTKQLNFLHTILEFCFHEDTQVRDTALNTVTQLHDRGDKSLSSIIEDYSVTYLK